MCKNCNNASCNSCAKKITRYLGPDLECINVRKGDNYDLALAKINQLLCDFEVEPGVEGGTRIEVTTIPPGDDCENGGVVLNVYDLVSEDLISSNVICNGSSGEDVDLPFVTPEMYGAVGDGTTDDSAAIQDAVDSGEAVYFSNVSYRVATSISIPSFSNLYGNGAVLLTTDDIHIFNITSATQLVNIYDFVFRGDNSLTNQNGINIVGIADLSIKMENIKITNCVFENLNYGFYTKWNYNAGVNKNPHATLSQCYARNCNVGFGCDVKSSQNYFEGCHIANCPIGYIDYGAANKFSGGSITGNSAGVDINGMGDASNVDGYSSIIGTTFSRNDTVIRVADRPYGYSFIGCDIINNGTIQILDSVLINFDSCKISLNTLTILRNKDVFFRDCTWITDVTLPVVAVTVPASGQKVRMLTCNFTGPRFSDPGIAYDLDTSISTATILDLPIINSIITYQGAANAIWTLPPLLGNEGLRLALMNDSAFNVTVETEDGSNTIYYSGGSTNSFILAPTDSANIVNTSVYYLNL